jgi:hypothetical protein
VNRSCHERYDRIAASARAKMISWSNDSSVV